MNTNKVKKLTEATSRYAGSSKKKATEQEEQEILNLERMLSHTEVRNLLEGQSTNFDGALNLVKQLEGDLNVEKFAQFFKDRANFSWDDALAFSTSISPLLVELFCENKGITKLTLPSNINSIETGAFTKLPLTAINFKNRATVVKIKSPVFNSSIDLPSIGVQSITNLKLDTQTQEGKDLTAQIEAKRQAARAAKQNGNDGDKASSKGEENSNLPSANPVEEPSSEEVINDNSSKNVSLANSDAQKVDIVNSDSTVDAQEGQDSTESED